jgi:hypothetical protein
MEAVMHDASKTTPSAWRERLGALIEARMATPFAWGSHDCCMWAANCVLAVSGVDLAAEYRGEYSTAAGAVALLQAAGGIEAMGARAGAPIPVLMAALGDVGLIVLDDRSLLAVCVGDHWLAPAAGGLAARPLNEASRAWRVAHG